MAQLILTWSIPPGCEECTFEYRYKLHSDSTYITGTTLSGVTSYTIPQTLI